MAAGKGRTYRYFSGQPLYPFGHGLSFTTFKYSDLKISNKTVNKNDSISVSVKIRNTGKMAGDEVVQLYVGDIESDLAMPIKQLRGFERVAIDKGQTKTVTFELSIAEDFKYYDPSLGKYNVEPGQFEIQIGASSSDIRVRDIITVN